MTHRSALFTLTFLLFCFGPGLFSFGSGLKLVKTIGDDRDDYIFFVISGAAINNQKEIYVSDHKGHFIAKYDWKGKFIKRIGQKGQGNGDFNGPGNLEIAGSRLYLNDSLNFRIAWTNLDLSRLEYRKLAELSINMKMLDTFKVLRHGQCIGSSYSPWDSKGRIVVLDWITNKWTAFFNHYPVEVDQGKIVKNINKKTKESMTYENSLSFLSFPVFGFDKKQGLLLITFESPDNPVRFYLYTKEGKEIKTVDYPVEKQYKFQDHYLYRKKGKPADSYFVVMDNILSYNGKFLAFVTKNHLGKKSGEIVDQFCLVFDKNGNIVDKFHVEPGLRVFCVSEEGYLLAKDYNAEEEKLFIYKVDLKK